MRHGEGKYFYYNGSVYTGKFNKNKRDGHGRLEVYKNG